MANDDLEMMFRGAQGLGGAARDVAATYPQKLNPTAQRPDKELVAQFEELIRSGRASPKEAAFLYQQKIAESQNETSQMTPQRQSMGPTPASQPYTPPGGVPGMRQGMGLGGPSPAQATPSPYPNNAPQGQRRPFGLSSALNQPSGQQSRFSTEDIGRLKDLGYPNIARDRLNNEADMERTRITQGSQGDRVVARNKFMSELETSKVSLEREKMRHQTEMLDRRLSAVEAKATTPKFSQTPHGVRYQEQARKLRTLLNELGRYQASMNSMGPDDEISKALQARVKTAEETMKMMETRMEQDEKAMPYGAPAQAGPSPTPRGSGLSQQETQELEQLRRELGSR